MDGLSAAASGIAVVSVAIQLAESFKKLSDFWKSIKEAPEDIRAISTDLDLLSSVLAEIARETQHVGPDDTLVAVLNACCGRVKLLTAIVNQIEPGFASASFRIRKWTALKAVSRRGELMKFQEALNSLKGTLLLVQQNQCNRLSRNRHIALEQNLAAIIYSVSSSSMQQHSLLTGRGPDKATNSLSVEGMGATDFGTGSVPLVQNHHSDSSESWSELWKPALTKFTLRESNTVTETLFGTVRATSNTTSQMSRKTGDLIPHGEKQHKTSITIYPAKWLIRLGVQCGFHLDIFSSSTQGWQNSLNTFCPVPDDALIFEFCQQGNVPAVRSLLSGGHASVRDTNSRGYTPLHFAAGDHHPELCEVLISAGADITTITHDADTPLKLAVHKSENVSQAMLSEVRDTFRLLIDSIDFSEDSYGWDIMDRLSMNAFFAHERALAHGSLLLSMLRLLSFELRTYVSEQHFARMLYWVSEPESELAEASDLLLSLGGHDVINAALYQRDGYSLLHQHLVLYVTTDTLTFILARGPDLHRLGFNARHTPYKESPTTLAMYSSNVFTSWLRALINHKVDLESFIDQEIEQNHEVHPGWERETLLDLFTHGDRPDLHLDISLTCSDCKRQVLDPLVQPYWRHLLERIRRRLHPYEPSLAGSEAGEEDDDNKLPPASNSKEDANEPSSKSDSEEDANELQSESGLEEDSSAYDSRGPIRSNCLYGKHENICMRCWLHYARTGTRFLPVEKLSESEDPTATEDSSDDEFSPFHIHS